MTMTTSNVGAERRWFSRSAGRLRQWPEQAEKRRLSRRGMKALSLLSDHLLRDVGLERNAAPRDAAIRHFWR